MSRLGRVARGAAALALAASTVACLEDVSGTRPITITISADVTTASVSQTVTFTFDATGTSLQQVRIDYDDGDEDARAYAGPVEVSDFFTHVFDSAGTFEVVAEVFAIEGSARDSITITVN